MNEKIDIPKNEIWIHNNPEILDSINRGFEDIKAGRIVKREIPQVDCVVNCLKCKKRLDNSKECYATNYPLCKICTDSFKTYKEFKIFIDEIKLSNNQ